MPRTSIFSTKITDLRPAVWHGKAVFRHASQLKTLLNDNLGAEYKHLFAEPLISDDALDGRTEAVWVSENFEKKGTPLSKLPDNERKAAEQKVAMMLSNVEQFAEKLSASADINSQRWGELLSHITQIPSAENVFVENGNICIAAWGFVHKDGTKSQYKLSEIKSSVISIPQLDETQVSGIEENTTPPETHSTAIEQDKFQQETNEIKPEIHTEKTNITDKTDNTKPPTTPPQDQKKPWYKRYWWIWLIILLLLLAFLIWLFFVKSPTGSKHLHDDEAVIPPIDTTKIIEDPDGGGKVMSNQLILWITDDTKTTEQFATDFKAKYPDKNYEIVYFNNTMKRVNIQFPDTEKVRLKKDLKTEFPDYKLIVLDETIFSSEFVPGDPGFKAPDQSWAYPKVKAYEAWDITKGSEDVLVAIIDDGFDLSHPELSGRMINPYNVPANNDKPNIGIVKLSHGTHVAGTAIGAADNGAGVSGIAPGCKFMPVQVGDAFGNMSTTAVIDAVMYCIAKKADVVNMSLGMPAPPGMASQPKEVQENIIKTKFKEQEQLWNEIFSIADKNNVTIVLAGGNDNVLIGLDPMQRTPYTINVSAIDPINNKARFSNWGDNSTVSAPGVQIYSSVPGSKYDFYDGTSMAAPIVTGAVALLKSKNPDLSNSEVKKILQETGISLSSPQNIGNLIQLSAALGNTDAEKDCPPEIKAKIDSLQEEIRKLEEGCKTASSGEELVIPDAPKDFEFAAGKWQSTTDLYNIRTKEPVELFFDFKKDGSGALTMREADGNTCSANLQLAFSGKTLNINQKNEAKCEDGGGYEKYKFSCTATGTGTATCTAKSSTDAKVIDFKLKRVK